MYCCGCFGEKKNKILSSILAEESGSWSKFDALYLNILLCGCVKLFVTASVFILVLFGRKMCAEMRDISR